ncbi:Molybdopterin synthase sulfur carrier subunit, partial [Ochromonadaceae sp. CCMP2298]
AEAEAINTATQLRQTSSLMKIKVMFFAAARELTGETETVLELAEGSTTQVIPETLQEMFPELDITRDRMSLAVNQVYCREPVALKEHDVVAVLPPISGG